MAKSRKQPEPAWDGDYNDEVDNFHEDQEKILLNQSGISDKAQDEYELSDEEVLGVDAESESEEEEKYYEENGNGENDQNEEGWGAAKRNYYGADEIEDEEAAKEEEQEALRIQKKHLSELNIEDFYDEDDMDEWKKTAESGLSETTELPDQDPSLLSKAEKLALLKASHPEVGPLTEELISLEPKLKKFKEELQSVKSQTASIKFAALSTYIGTIYAYFALFVGKVEKGKVDLKNHQVMEGILKARELWRRASEIRDSNVLSDDIELVEEADEVDVESEQEEFQDARDSFDSDGSDEYQELPSIKRQRVHHKSESDSDEFAIAKPRVQAKTEKAKKVSAVDDEQETDEEEKEKRKRTLRFYTSKIDQRSNKMDQKAYGGDDDLPYKEREFERRQRLLEEARIRGLKSKVPDEADDFGSDEDDDNTSINDNDGDLYDKAKASSKQKKEARKQAHREAVTAAKEGRLAELDDSLGDGEKRAINYQILKNKGLTPKRRKENRNARVKKRKKYDEAKKKLKSVRAVYQAPTSSYGGETTGIKKNVVRSVHFKA